MRASSGRGRLVAQRACLLTAILLLPQASPADTLRPSKPGQAEELFDKGLAALKRNDLVSAENAFSASLKLDPKAVAPMLGLAQIASKRGQHQAAVDYVHRAFLQAPDDADVQRNWARYKYSEGLYQEAENALRHAMQVDPAAARPRIDLGDLYVLAYRKPAEAIPFYKEAIRLEPKHAGAHYGLGMALGMTGQRMEAVAELNQAATLAPTNPLPYYRLGRLHESERRLDQAMEAFGLALRARPAFAPAFLERGKILLAKNDSAGALREFQNAAAADSALAEPHLQLGMIYQQRRQWSNAQEAYLAAIARNPQEAIAYNNLAWMATESGVQLNDALKWARKAVSIAPDVSQFQTTLGWVQRARGDLGAAADALAKAAAMKPPRADALYYLAIVRLDQGRRAEGTTLLKKALALDPAFSNAPDAQHRLKALDQS